MRVAVLGRTRRKMHNIGFANARIALQESCAANKDHRKATDWTEHERTSTRTIKLAPQESGVELFKAQRGR